MEDPMGSGQDKDCIKGLPQKEKQSANASALFWSSPVTAFFPCGSLIFRIEPGPKRCTRIRGLLSKFARFF